MLEDSALHASLPILVWLLVAQTRGYSPLPAMRSYLLSLVAAIAGSPIRDEVPEARQPFRPVSREMAAMAAPHRDLLLSVQLRKAFGGLAGDVALCDAACLAWSDALALKAGSRPATDLPPVDCAVLFSLFSLVLASRPGY